MRIGDLYVAEAVGVGVNAFVLDALGSEALEERVEPGDHKGDPARTHPRRVRLDEERGVLVDVSEDLFPGALEIERVPLGARSWTLLPSRAGSDATGTGRRRTIPFDRSRHSRMCLHAALNVAVWWDARMTDAEEAYVNALLNALVRDLVDHPVPGRLARVVIRWFENADPLYLTIHALGTDEENEIAEGDAWYPLEWPNVDREEARGDRIVNDSAVQAAGPALAQEYAEAPDMEDGEWRASPTLIEVARRAPDALRAAGAESADHMLVLAAHFEGGGAAHVMEQVGPPERVVAALRERGELPDE